ncbi:MAG: YitT family protein [Bacteroidales bacterium]|nr:YitT family protein [Bacteroidales bacterium]
MSKSVKDILSEVKAYFLIALGLLIYSIAWTIFIIPNGLLGGGITGVSALINYCTGFNISYSYAIINTILILIALKVLGSSFGAKTIFAIAILTVLLKVVPSLIPTTFIEELNTENGRFIGAICAGILAGVGIAITISQGGSTGGTDIIALIVNKFRRIPPGKTILYCDIIIVACTLIIPSEDNWSTRIATMLYGYILIVVNSFTLDLVLNGRKQSTQIMVFSSKYEELAERICKDMNRGVTLLDSQGGYTRNPGKVLVIVLKRTETNAMLKLIGKVDPEAFISVGSVTGVYGKGFDPMLNQ